MGGVAVANGSTLSTTGEMQVTCNVPYTLSVDGVEWVPTASAGGVDTYLLSTSGVVRIFINGTRYFLFTNSINADFDIVNVTAIRIANETNVESYSETGKYIQATFSQGEGYPVILVKGVGLTGSELIQFGANCNNGNVIVDSPSWDSDVCRIEVSNYDWSSYGAVFVGNVLVAFIEPIS